MAAERTSFPASGVRSLTWCGDELIDWIAAGNRYCLDGTIIRSGYSSFAYRFDSAVSTRDGRAAVIYERRGTKGLVIAGREMREVNRSYYHADDYEYPICLWSDSTGRALLAHCPDEYNRIEIEDAITGERLSGSPDRKSGDFFHSRFQTNPCGSRLLSAGWVWHPWSSVCWCEIADLLEESAGHDSAVWHSAQAFHVGLVEEASACWQTDDRILISGGPEDADPEEIKAHGDRPRLKSNGIVAYDIPSQAYVQDVLLDQPVGRMMPVGEDRVMAFHGYPRLVSLRDGRVIEEWPELPTGRQSSSILRGETDPPPPLAIDPEHGRFAVFVAGEIHVVSV